MPGKTRKSSSRRGRPPMSRSPAGDAGDARRRLLDAAARRFAASGFAGTSLRQVAQQARVTPAMVSYYFADKNGLLEAVLLEGVELLLAALRDGLDAPAGKHETVLARFVAAYLGALNANPWIPRVVVQEVISRDTPLRDLFVERFANRALELVTPMLRDEMQAGRLRRDLDIRLTVMSVIGMCIFPYIAEPLLGRLLNYRIDDAFARKFVPHTVALLEQALEPRS
jgi:TetR/AcrR family transcriptional regulator